MRLFATVVSRGVHDAWPEKTIMPSKFKKRVRERMQKTGETWQQAARHVRADTAHTSATATNEQPKEETMQTGIAALVARDPAHWAVDGTWFPLRQDGLWLAEERWERNLAWLRRRSDGTRSLAALRSVFTPAWSRELRGTTGLHPVVGDAIMVGGRYRLMEVGHMLGDLSRRKAARSRLLAHDQYSGTCAELRAGLLLRTLGASLTWEPVSEGSGPDWLAAWPGGELAFEVKCPRVSTRVEDVLRVEQEFLSEFMRALSAPPLPVDSGVWLTFHPSGIMLGLKSPFGSVDLDAVRSLAREAAQGVRNNTPRPTASGRFPAGRAGDFSIALGLGEAPQVQFAMDGIRVDQEYEEERLIETIRKAAAQLDALDVPGVVLLDEREDSGLSYRMGAIQDALLGATWATRLAGVVVHSLAFTADENREDMRPHNVVSIVPGLRAAALEHTLMPGLRLCDRRHLHADPLVAPPSRCNLRL